MTLLVLWESSKALYIMPAFRPYLYLAPKAPYDSLLASGALYSLLAAWLLTRRGGFGRWAVLTARGLTVLSARYVC